MALGSYTPVNAPTQGSNIVADVTLSNYVFATGVHKPEFSQYLTYCYPQYTLTSLLDRIGRFEPVGQDKYEWAEVERTREVATVSAGGISVVAGVATITTDETQLYFVARDIIKLGDDTLALVSSNSLVGGQQTIVMEALDSGTPLVAGNFTVGDKLSHLYDLHEEYSNEPTARVYLPVKRSNDLNILRRTISISTTEWSNIVWMNINGKPYWYYADEHIAMSEFARDREIAILLGETPVTPSVAVKGGKGIIPDVTSGGVVGTFAGDVVEGDIMEQIKALVIASPADEFLVLAGSEFMKDLTVSLRDYYVGGGVDFGLFSTINTVGLNLQSYKFLGKTIHFVHYQLFDDPKVFPSNSAGIDYSDFSLWLNMGNDENGRPLISGKFKKDPNGVEYKFLRKFTPGISSPTTGEMDGVAANGRDGFTVHLYSYVGVETRCLNQHGILRRA